MEPGLVGREDDAATAAQVAATAGRYGARPRRPGRHLRVEQGVGVQQRAAMEPGLVGREDVQVRVERVQVRPAAMEPGLVGREDAELGTRMVEYTGPLRSPASSAGKTLGIEHDVAAGVLAAMEPGLVGREDVGLDRLHDDALAGAAMEPGLVGREDDEQGLGRAVEGGAAMEPGLVGREDAAASSAATATPPCRYGARPRRPGRQLARIIGADLWICRGLRAVVCSCSTLVGKLVGWFAESWPDRAASARQVWLVDLSARIR